MFREYLGESRRIFAASGRVSQRQAEEVTGTYLPHFLRMPLHQAAHPGHRTTQFTSRTTTTDLHISHTAHALLAGRLPAQVPHPTPHTPSHTHPHQQLWHMCSPQAAFHRKYPARPGGDWRKKAQRYRPPGSAQTYQVPLGQLVSPKGASMHSTLRCAVQDSGRGCAGVEWRVAA